MNSKPNKPTKPHARTIATRKRGDAVTAFAQSAFFLSIPLILFFCFKITLPIWVYIVFLIGVYVYYSQARQHWIHAIRADKGADGEDKVESVLQKLPEGWSVQRGLRFDGIGDIDFFVRSPAGKAYVLEVKAHSGKVSWNGEKLCRLNRGSGGVPFEKDFITQVLVQCSRVRQAKRLRNVTPVLVFSQAEVLLKNRDLRNVHVIQLSELMDYLLGHTQHNVVAEQA